MARPRQLHCRIDPRPHQIAHRLVHGVWHPHRCQLAGAVQNSQSLRVTPVGLDPVARPGWDQRWRDNRTAMAELGDLAIEAVAAGTGLVAELQPVTLLGQPARQLRDIQRRVRNRADEADLPVATLLHNRYRDAGLVNIEPDVSRCFRHDPSARSKYRARWRGIRTLREPGPHLTAQRTCGLRRRSVFLSPIAKIAMARAFHDGLSARELYV